MRTTLLLAATIMVTACTTSLERQSGSAARSDCREQAEAYVRANMASIANEWREQEKYKQYQKCLVERMNSES